MKKAWELSDLLKRARPIKRNPINDKSAIKTIKNPTKGKSTKVKMKSAKGKYKSVTDKEKFKSVEEESKSAMEIVKNPTNHERSKHGVVENQPRKSERRRYGARVRKMQRVDS